MCNAHRPHPIPAPPKSADGNVCKLHVITADHETVEPIDHEPDYCAWCSVLIPVLSTGPDPGPYCSLLCAVMADCDGA